MHLPIIPDRSQVLQVCPSKNQVQCLGMRAGAEPKKAAAERAAAKSAENDQLNRRSRALKKLPRLKLASQPP